ncbi:MAG: transketolase [Erysipelotrichaceae bacterium]
MNDLELKKLAAQIRIDVLKMLKRRGYGHIGGSLSVVELLSVLYGRQMKHDPNNPKDPNRDYLVLSKGHAGPGLYATLANMQYFDKDLLYTLNEGGTNLPSHPDRTKTIGVDMTTGSLGQGCSTATGIALGLKLRKMDNYVYLIVGDGELNEGQCWEAFQFIASNKLNNCIVIIDENKRQLDGFTNDIIYPFSIYEKMKAFGFYTQVVKGDDINKIDEAINQLKSINDQAVCLVLDTIKGQGVKYFEDLESNHSVKWNNEATNLATDEAIKQLELFIKEGQLYD